MFLKCWSDDLECFIMENDAQERRQKLELAKQKVRR